jgi:NAD(P)-dependent dehydrogenase (short-subunit alcohol dehydrogenase family)
MIRFDADDRFLVTGASSGIGRACALQLVAAGATVIAVGRSAETLATLRAEASAAARVLPVIRDLARDLDTLPDFVGSLARTHGPLAGVVSIAGALSNVPLRALHLPALRDMFALNSVAPLALVAALARNGVARPQASALLMSSVSSVRGLTGAAGYSASKGALDALTLAAARELAPRGLRVNAILPAVVDTPMTAGVPSDQLAWMTDLQPIAGRIEARDVAALAAYLLSDRARFITGACIALDGGCGLCLKPALTDGGALGFLEAIEP